jgi:preprotein translocase subunit SecE
MVFVMSILAAAFFFLVDWVVSNAVKLVLGAGG